jgi:hypothetical protein
MPDEESSQDAAAAATVEPEIQFTALQAANLALLLVLSALSGIWLSAYTEWFPRLKEWAAGGSGFFLASGIAALIWGGVSKPGRKLLLFLLRLRVFTAALAILLLAFAFFAASRGALRLELTKEFREDFVEVFDSSRRSLARRIPPAEGEFRVVVPAPLWSSATSWLAVKNRPYEPVVVEGLWRRPLISVPLGLKREVVLLYGSDPFLRFTANGPGADLTIDIHCHDGRVLHATRRRYKGQALWLGCRKEVELPADVRAALVADMKNTDDALLRPTCPYDSEEECEFAWDNVAGASVQWKLGRYGKTLPIEFHKLDKIAFVRRRPIEF